MLNPFLKWMLVPILILAACNPTPSTGKLSVVINGLSGTGATADVKVTGTGTNQTLTASTALDLAPGSYTVTANKVSTNTASFTPTVSGSPAQVTAGQTKTVTVTYVLDTPGSGSISGTVSIGTSPANMDFMPGEAIVRFRDTVTLQSVQVLQAGGVSLQQVESLGVPGAALYRASADKATTLQMIRELSARSDVLYAHPNYIMHPFKTSNDEFFSKQWDLPAIKVPEAWDIEDGNSNAVTVAVIDTGILAQHPDFAGKIAPGGFDFISNPQISNDGDGRDTNPEDTGDSTTAGGQGSYHGAHVAGTIAAATNNTVGIAGMSWGAKILPLRVLGKGGGTVADIIAAMRYAANLGGTGIPNNPSKAQIINMSLGGSGQCSAVQIYQDTINAVLAAGSIIVVAAGNDNVDASGFAPASCSGVITVGATDPNTKRARYSNFGARIDMMAPGGDVQINLGGQQSGGGILAPGLTDATKQFNWNFKNGTSMAAPHVAGLLALMKSKKPSLTFSEALDILKRTSVALTETQCDGNRPELTVNDCGSGLINAQAALQALTAAPAQDFTLSLSPNSLSSAPNQTATITVNINRTGGFTGAVNLSLVGVLQGISGSFNPASVTGNTSTLTLNIGNLAAGSYSLSVQGVSGAITRTAELNVTISSNPGGNIPTLQGALVGACFYDPVVLCDDAKSKEQTLNSTQTSAPYQFTNLAAGDYIILGWKDINNNNDPDEGDYLGLYIENGDIGLVKPSRTGINFSLDLVQETPTQVSEDQLRKIAKSLFR